MIEWLDLPPKAELTDRFGIVRKLYGCSLIGRAEFFERILQLAQCMADSENGETFQQLYDSNKRVNHLVNRLLELNGLEPDWFTIYQVEQLLLSGENGEESVLIRLNKPKETAESSASKKVSSATMEDILASVSTHFGTDIKGALELSSKLPADFLLNLLEAKNLLAAPPKEKAKKEMRKNKDHLKKQLEKIQSGAVEGVVEEDGRS